MFDPLKIRKLFMSGRSVNLSLPEMNRRRFSWWRLMCENCSFNKPSHEYVCGSTAKKFVCLAFRGNVVKLSSPYQLTWMLNLRKIFWSCLHFYQFVSATLQDRRSRYSLRVDRVWQMNAQLSQTAFFCIWFWQRAIEWLSQIFAATIWNAGAVNSRPKSTQLHQFFGRLTNPN